MVRYWLAAALVLAPASAAWGDEIDGLESHAVDISANLEVPIGARRGEYGVAFLSRGEHDIPNGITIQSRPEGGLAPSCSVTLPLPPSAVQVSRPAITDSGWLFVSSFPDTIARRERVLYAMRRITGMMSIGRNHCQGWSGEWERLDSPGSIASAPDAVVLGGRTFVFVADREHRIQYRFFPGRPGEWSSWRPVNPSSRSPIEIWSQPAAALYSANPMPGAGITGIHLFWLDQSRRQVRHISGWGDGDFMLWGPVAFRPLGDEAGDATATTACSASPDIRAPNPLFIVCGNSRGTYSIAHYRNPAREWSDGLAIEPVGGRAWISRSMYGGNSAPALRNRPTMFLAVGPAYCPDRPGRQRLPGPTCFNDNSRLDNSRWLIERRWAPVGVTLPPPTPSPQLPGWNPASSYTRGAQLP